MPIVRADPEAHRGFIRSSWVLGCGHPWHVLQDLLDHGARAAVLTGADPNLFVGWAAVAPELQTIIWVYVKPIARGRGLMGLLLHPPGDRPHPTNHRSLRQPGPSRADPQGLAHHRSKGKRQ
jgi:hypothetical protein